MRLPFDLGALWERALAWYNHYSQRDRRIILGVLIAVGVSLVYVGVIEPILDYRKAVGREIADGQFELERAMRFVGAKDTLRAEREDLRRRLTQAKTRLLPGGTATLGAAALQERANAIASEKQITVQSTQVMKEEVVEPFRKVAVRLTLSGELQPLAELVSALEYQQQLAVPFVEVSRRGAVAGAKGPRTLSITLEVSGFVQAGAGGKGEGGDAEAAAASGDAAAGATGEPGADASGSEASGDGAAPPDGAPSPAVSRAPSEGAPPPGPVPQNVPAAPPPGPQAPAPVPGPPGPGAALPAPAGAPTPPVALPVPATGGPAAVVPPVPGANGAITAPGATMVPITFPPMNLPAPTVPTTLAPAAPAPPGPAPAADDAADADDEDGE